MAEIRQARAEDAARLAQMLHDFNLEFGDPSPGPDVIEQRVRAFIEDGRKTYLLDADRHGFAQVSFNPSVWTDESVGLLEELYVVPDRRGGGIGRALMEAVLALAQERRAASMRARPIPPPRRSGTT